jgi:GT2 family glycosyltransferase
MNKLGVLVLNRNGRNWLPTVYNSILDQGFSRADIYLVDNASEDDSVALTREGYPQVTVIRMPRNLGYCMAYNLAMPYAFADGCDWVVWANNDIKLEPNCLTELARVAASDPRIGALGPAFLAWEKDEPNYYILGNHPYAIPALEARSQAPIDVEWAEGSFLMVSRQCVQSVGPLDPYLFFYWEETDFCRRARYRGWRVVLAPSAVARHYAGGWSEGNQENRLTANRLQARNFCIYKLANPFSSFTRNFLDTTHLLAFYLRESLISKPSLAYFHLKVFATVLANLPTIHKKWMRDREGEPPPELQSGMLPVAPEIIHGKRIISACAIG